VRGASRRSPWFLGLVRRYARRTVARELDGLMVDGLERTRLEAARRPVILAANHVAWWDPFLLVTLDEALGTEGHALMDAANLDRLRFFSRIGCVPIDAANPRPGLRDAARLLDRPGRTLWIFPQGRLRPAHLRPLDFRGGVQLLARQAPQAAVVPVGVQYAFGEGRYPAAYAAFGAPLEASAVGARDGLGRLEAAVAERLARIDRHLAGEGEMETLVAGRGGRADEGAGARLLSALFWRRGG
jgi:1-acyl-sn-glycerol-3-phosphate acyltransferase